MAGPLDRLEAEARTVKSNSGKLFLAAIVHYDSCPAQADSCDKTGAEWRPSNQTARVAGGEQQVAGVAPRRRFAKLARLFSLRLNKRPANGAESTALKMDDNEKCEADLEQRARDATCESILMDRLGLQTGRRQSDAGDPSGKSGGALECQLVSESPAGHWRRRHRERKVIEFKFDLIVEGDQRDEDGLATPASHQPNGRALDPSAENILRPIKQRKLLDQVNELVEAFVLDSLDGCLMSAGWRHLAASSLAPDQQFDYTLELAKLTLTYAFQLLEASGQQRPPNYLANLERASLLKIEAFSIELEATLFETGAGKTGDNSIQISDLLAADLAPPSLAPGARSINQRLECRTVEGALEVLQLIRVNLDKINCKSSADQNNNTNSSNSNRLLMISLKLKQLINGGSFTNRLCLLDMAEPATSELSSILSAIFNGQALGYLKREKVHLRSLEMQLDLMRRTHERRLSESCDSGTAPSEPFESTEEFHQKHHRIASLTRLIQAQWLIYKQLSAALIKTLVIVHCHRSTMATKTSAKATTTTTSNTSENHLERLMEYNLELLEFARTLERASSSRLRRRRRHLRSHLNSATNLSFVSDTNLSIANLTDEEEEATCSMRLHAYQMGGQLDLMIGSPMRRLAAYPASMHYSSAGQRRGRRPSCLDCFESQHDDDDNDDVQSSQYDLSASNRSRLSHHQRRVERARSSGRHQHHQHHGHSHRYRHRHRHHEHRYDHNERQRRPPPLCDDQLSIDTASYQDVRASSLSGGRGRRRQSERLTGSSSLASTSSGSQRGHKYATDTSEPLSASSTQPPTSSKLAQLISYQRQLSLHQQQQMSPFQQQQLNQKLLGAPSDTEDSLASANLNLSCSSQSMRDRQRSGDLHRLLRVMQNGPGATAGDSREDEFRWLNAGASTATAGAKLQMARKLSNALDSASESTSIDSPSIELQSFCSTSNIAGPGQNSRTALHTAPGVPTTTTPAANETQSPQSAGNQNEDRLLDNASDTCSMVAEPPRQLKLEEFLNQLSSAIALPNNTATQRLVEQSDALAMNQSAKLNGANLPSGRKQVEERRRDDDEEEEDCKSHSSILDHLSSLTLETNLRLRLQSTPIGDHLQDEAFEAYRLHSGLLSSGQDSGRVNIVDEDDGRASVVKPVGGHLQQLLKSTLDMHNSDALKRQYQQERLKALSIDCNPDGARPVDMMLAHVPANSAQTNCTPPSSDSCGSGSSSSSSGDQNGNSSGPESLPQGKHVPSLAINQLYSSVIRQHT